MLPTPMIAVVIVHSLEKPRFVVPLVLGSCSCFLLRFQRRACWGFATGAATCSSVRRSIRPGDHQQRRRCDLAPRPGRQCRIGICGSSKRSPATWRTGASAASYFITSDTVWALPPSALLAYVASKGAL